MTSATDPLAHLIWATRGRTWGFRFLLDACLSDPLPAYENAFRGLDAEGTAWRRGGGVVAVRFADPLGRKDESGRVIPHDFVLYGDLANSVTSVDDAVREVWPLVAGVYASSWNAAVAPSRSDVRHGG